MNEAVDVASAFGYTESIFYEILGPEYIADAFRFARIAMQQLTAACVLEPACEGVGLADSLDEGAHAFSSEVMIDGTEDEGVDAMLVLEFESGATEAFNIATVPATPGEWTELSGYLGLGFEEKLISAELLLNGPSPEVELCVRAVSLGPVTTE